MVGWVLCVMCWMSICLDVAWKFDLPYGKMHWCIFAIATRQVKIEGVKKTKITMLDFSEASFLAINLCALCDAIVVSTFVIHPHVIGHCRKLV